MTVAALADRIDRLLPQTQCGQCGFAGCRPYAEALAAGTSELNRCPPGGVAGIHALAELLGREELPLDSACGTEKPRVVAIIDEAVCIGCTKCIQVCPVDAIIGAPKLMHTVITDECTGCELCLMPCPVDCIALPPAGVAVATRAMRDHARTRYEARRARRARDEAERVHRVATRPSKVASTSDTVPMIDKDAVLAAVARAKAKRAARGT